MGLYHVRSWTWGDLLRPPSVGWLVGLPEGREPLRRQEWLAWEVRYWALAVSLARIGQLYAKLEQRQGREAATETLHAALRRTWSQALENCELVHSAEGPAGVR